MGPFSVSLSLSGSRREFHPPAPTDPGKPGAVQTKLRLQLGLPEGFTFHDLRHTGNNLTSATGANIRELMRRMGHSTMRAALIYQHGSLDRDRKIAKAIEARVKKAKDKKPKKAKKIK
jgi:integrase